MVKQFKAPPGAVYGRSGPIAGRIRKEVPRQAGQNSERVLGQKDFRFTPDKALLDAHDASLAALREKMTQGGLSSGRTEYNELNARLAVENISKNHNLPEQDKVALIKHVNMRLASGKVHDAQELQTELKEIARSKFDMRRQGIPTI